MAAMAMKLVLPTLHYNTVETAKLYSHTVAIMPSSELKLSQETQMEIKHTESQTTAS